MKKTEMSCSKIDFMKTFVGYELPTIHQGFVQDTLHNELPKKISFAFVDCDLYEPLLYSLEMLHDRMVYGSIIIMHDWDNNNFPGAKKAGIQFLANHPNTYNVYECGLLILEKIDASKSSR